jgi:hypothetical protein
MTAKNNERHDEDELSKDLMYGAEPIGRFIGRPPRWVYHHQKNLGLGHVGATLVGSKSGLKKRLTGNAD